LWAVIITSTPATNKIVSADEKRYIVESLAGEISEKKASVTTPNISVRMACRLTDHAIFLKFVGFISTDLLTIKISFVNSTPMRLLMSVCVCVCVCVRVRVRVRVTPFLLHPTSHPSLRPMLPLVSRLLTQSPGTNCDLDPISTALFRQCSHILFPVLTITNIVNLSISNWQFTRSIQKLFCTSTRQKI